MPLLRRGKQDNRLRSVWTATIADHVVALVWSPDGRRVAAAAVSGPLSLFDAPSGKLIHSLAGHDFGTVALDWQPGGTLLASAGQDGLARLWDATTDQPVAEMPGGAAWVERVTWAPDGSVLATAASKIARLWDPGGKQLREYANHPATISDLAWRPNPLELTVAHYGGVSLYNPDRDEVAHVLAWKGSPLKLAWSPDARVLAHGNQDATVHFWQTEQNEPLQMMGFPTKVRELSWDTTSRYLATGGSAAACLWDCSGPGPEGRKPQMLLEDDAQRPISAIAWQRRGYLIASAAQDGRIRLWQPANKKEPLVGRDDFADGSATTLAWSPDDKFLAAGSSAGVVALYRIT